MAASLVFYSPLLTIFWYDKPSAYHDEPEMEWFEQLQTVFDESRVLDGAPGKGITMARRKADEWFVGTMANNDGGEVDIPLSFLGGDPKQKYTAYIYTDGGEAVETATHVRCSQLTVTPAQTLKFALQPSGGAAVRLVPADREETHKHTTYKGNRL